MEMEERLATLLEVTRALMQVEMTPEALDTGTPETGFRFGREGMSRHQVEMLKRQF